MQGSRNQICTQYYIIHENKAYILKPDSINLWLRCNIQ